MGLFDEIFGNRFGGALTAEQLKAQREMEADAMQQFDPVGALLLNNLQVLTGFRNYLTPEECAQINLLTRGVVGRLGMQHAPLQQGTAIIDPE